MGFDSPADQPKPWAWPAAATAAVLPVPVNAAVVYFAAVHHFLLVLPVPAALLGVVFGIVSLRRAQGARNVRLLAWTGLLLNSAAVVWGVLLLDVLAISRSWGNG